MKPYDRLRQAIREVHEVAGTESEPFLREQLAHANRLLSQVAGHQEDRERVLMQQAFGPEADPADGGLARTRKVAAGPDEEVQR